MYIYITQQNNSLLDNNYNNNTNLYFVLEIAVH